MVAKADNDANSASHGRRRRPTSGVGRKSGGSETNKANALRAYRSAAKAVEAISKTSNIIDSSKEEQIACVRRDEICVGKLLGKGGFSCVYEIRCVKQPEAPPDSNDSEERKRRMREYEMRKFLADHCIREKTGDSRYVVKFLQPSVMEDRRQFRMGAVDLAIEAKILSNLDHPNIVKIRGLSREGVAGYVTGSTPGYFFILDRLYDTLRARMEIWKAQESKFQGLIRGKVLDSKGKKRRGRLADRLKVAFDIAGALKYLHENNIIYRDLKPDNVGFDVRGEVKLFDFGLARELHPKRSKGHQQKGCLVEDERFNLTGKTGTQRYMAPEVALWKPYNFKVDVYSLGTMLWEMVSLRRAYDELSREMHSELVLKGSARPPLNNQWPFLIRSLMEHSWSPDPTERPTMKTMYGILMKEIQTMRRGKEATCLKHSRRRSTFALQGDDGPGFFERGREERKVSPMQ